MPGTPRTPSGAVESIEDLRKDNQKMERRLDNWARKFAAQADSLRDKDAELEQMRSALEKANSSIDCLKVELRLSARRWSRIPKRALKLRIAEAAQMRAQEAVRTDKQDRSNRAANSEEPPPIPQPWLPRWASKASKAAGPSRAAASQAAAQATKKRAAGPGGAEPISRTKAPRTAAAKAALLW